MGKKEKNKKKGKGAEKTADKTEKKIKIKLKKAIGEDDIESVVKAIEEEERKRQEVKEVSLGEVGPSHRSNFSFVVHPENPELILFGGEFYNGQKTELNNDLLQYDIKRKSWKQVKSPAGPASRCAHQGKLPSTFRTLLLDLTFNTGFFDRIQILYAFLCSCSNCSSRRTNVDFWRRIC